MLDSVPDATLPVHLDQVIPVSAGLDFWRRIYRQTSPWTHYSNTWIQVVTPIKLFLIYSLRTLSVNSSLVL